MYSFLDAAALDALPDADPSLPDVLDTPPCVYQR
jgi:hypothetical protein